MIRDGYGLGPEEIAQVVEWLRLSPSDEEGDMDFLIEWCKTDRHNLQSQLDALTSGKLRLSENDGSGWIDTTEERIAWLTVKINDLDRLLFEIDRRKAYRVAGFCKGSPWAL